MRAANPLAVLVLLCGAAFAATVPVKDLVRQLPAQEAAAAQETCAKLLKGGKATIGQIIALLCEPGKAPDKDAAELNVKARYALHGLALYVARPEAEAERKLFVETLLEALGSAKPASIKGFLIRQLQLAGGEDAVGTIAQFLLGPGQRQPKLAPGGELRRRRVRQDLGRCPLRGWKLADDMVEIFQGSITCGMDVAGSAYRTPAQTGSEGTTTLLLRLHRRLQQR